MQPSLWTSNDWESPSYARMTMHKPIKCDKLSYT